VSRTCSTTVTRPDKIARTGSKSAQPPADLGGKALLELGVVSAFRRLPDALVEAAGVDLGRIQLASACAMISELFSAIMIVAG
jgi:hypothetical protein